MAPSAHIGATDGEGVRRTLGSIKPAQDAFWSGYHFAHPDSYPWEVAWNPEWTIAEDGGVRLKG